MSLRQTGIIEVIGKVACLVLGNVLGCVRYLDDRLGSSA